LPVRELDRARGKLLAAALDFQHIISSGYLENEASVPGSRQIERQFATDEHQRALDHDIRAIGSFCDIFATNRKALPKSRLNAWRYIDQNATRAMGDEKRTTHRLRTVQSSTRQ
jgi:hypothetical protein